MAASSHPLQQSNKIKFGERIVFFSTHLQEKLIINSKCLQIWYKCWPSLFRFYLNYFYWSLSRHIFSFILVLTLADSKIQHQTPHITDWSSKHLTSDIESRASNTENKTINSSSIMVFECIFTWTSISSTSTLLRIFLMWDHSVKISLWDES